MSIEFFKIPKKGTKPKKLLEILVENELLVTFRSLIEVNMTFYGQMDGCIVFGRSKSIGNEVSNMIIPFLDFFLYLLAKFLISLEVVTFTDPQNDLNDLEKNVTYDFLLD